MKKVLFLDNNTSLLGNKSEKTKDGKVIPLESITNTESKTYQVVGFYSRPSFESFHAPGYTALTLSSARTSYQDIYFCLYNSKDVSSFLEQNAPYSYTMNYDLLRLDGASMEDSFKPHRHQSCGYFDCNYRTWFYLTDL